jgi:hypothetical protein
VNADIHDIDPTGDWLVQLYSNAPIRRRDTWRGRAIWYRLKYRSHLRIASITLALLTTALAFALWGRLLDGMRGF